jgi:uncharacterized protein (TIGR03435 family)
MCSRWPLFAAFSSALLAQTTAPAPRFEIAEIHRSAAAGNPQTYRSGGFLRGDRYSLRKATLMDILALAYGFDPGAVFGGPDWLEFDRFDISAKAPPATSPADIRLMLQSLLADRFQLAFHNDVRPMPVFALRTIKNVRLPDAAASGNPECRYQRQPESSPYTVCACRNTAMADFARQLRTMASDYLADPVIDATGLPGAMDFDLKWTSRSGKSPSAGNRNRSSARTAHRQHAEHCRAASPSRTPV